MKPERKTEQLVFRLTERERRDLEQIAKHQGVRLSAFLRKAVSTAIDKAILSQGETPIERGTEAYLEP